jgi:hypothetical protein
VFGDGSWCSPSVVDRVMGEVEGESRQRGGSAEDARGIVIALAIG